MVLVSNMIRSFLDHLGKGPSSLAGGAVFAICIVACIAWVALAMGYTDEVPDSEKRRLGSLLRLVEVYAPRSFVRSAFWFFPAVFLLYVVCVYI